MVFLQVNALLFVTVFTSAVFQPLDCLTRIV